MFGGYGMGFGGGFMWIIWLLLVAVIVWAVIRTSSSDQRSDSRPSARDVLDRRFAEGEIDESEYRQRRKLLGDG